MYFQRIEMRWNTPYSAVIRFKSKIQDFLFLCACLEIAAAVIKNCYWEKLVILMIKSSLEPESWIAISLVVVLILFCRYFSRMLLKPYTLAFSDCFMEKFFQLLENLSGKLLESNFENWLVCRFCIFSKTFLTFGWKSFLSAPSFSVFWIKATSLTKSLV